MAQQANQPLPNGHLLEEYTIDRQLSLGGFSIVYLATDTAGRLGGEEFGVLLPETSGSQALEVAERLREAFADAPVGLPDGRSVSYTVSIGVTSLLSGQHADLDILFAQADHALYAAKDAGRNRVCTHRPGGAVQ